jgi:hypothetical protein
MIKCLFLIFGFCMVLNAQSVPQSVNVGFSGLSHIAKFEANYSLNKKIDVGAFYGLGIRSLSPHYIGATGKYQFMRLPRFNNSKVKDGAYVGSSMGLAFSPSYEAEVFDYGFPVNITVKAEKKFCGSVFLGFEQYIRWISTFEELHLGYMPNIMSLAFKALKDESFPSKYSWWAYQMGIRFNIGTPKL